MLWMFSRLAFATPAIIPQTGDIIDDSDICFEMFGPAQYWRSETQGLYNGLHWTNALTGTGPHVNWAWWELDFIEEGDYLVEYYSTPAFALFNNVEYSVMADGIDNSVYVDQGSSTLGWNTIGTFHFAVGASQYVAIYDTGPAASGQHIVADAIRLTRVGNWCGDGVCSTGDGEDCSSCASDCLLPAEIDNNGIDDDCNGLVDDDIECNGQSFAQWCDTTFILGECQGGNYFEQNCATIGQICSEQSLQCIDAACDNRENDAFCDGSVVQDCRDGQLFETDCSNQGKTCQNGQCVSIAEPSSEPTSEPTTEPTSEPASPSAEPTSEPSDVVVDDTGLNVEDTGQNGKDTDGCVGLKSSFMLMLLPLLRRRRKDSTTSSET